MGLRIRKRTTYNWGLGLDKQVVERQPAIDGHDSYGDRCTLQSQGHVRTQPPQPSYISPLTPLTSAYYMTLLVKPWTLQHVEKLEHVNRKA